MVKLFILSTSFIS